MTSSASGGAVYFRACICSPAVRRAMTNGYSLRADQFGNDQNYSDAWPWKNNVRRNNW